MCVGGCVCVWVGVCVCARVTVRVCVVCVCVGDNDDTTFTDIANFPSINATVNKTVPVECRSNCSTIRLLTKQGTDPEEEIRPHTELQPVSGYEYGVEVTLVLNASLNNATLICKALGDGKSYANKFSVIRLQGQLIMGCICDWFHILFFIQNRYNL